MAPSPQEYKLILAKILQKSLSFSGVTNVYLSSAALVQTQYATLSLFFFSVSL